MEPQEWIEEGRCSFAFFSPFSEAPTYSHWSHSKASVTASTPPESVVGDDCCFLAKNTSLRLAFLRSVEGLAFFLGDWLGDALLLVSREKEKPEPVEIEMLKTWP